MTSPPLRLIVIKRRDFAALMRDVLDVTQNILVTLSKRLRQVALGGR